MHRTKFVENPVLAACVHVSPSAEYAILPDAPPATNSFRLGTHSAHCISDPPKLGVPAWVNTLTAAEGVALFIVDVVPMVASVGFVMLLVNVAEFTSRIFFVLPAAVAAAEYVNNACAMLAPVFASFPVEVFKKTMFESA